VHPLSGLFLASVACILGGCAAPVGVAVASYAADGVLLIATDKTATDHGLSMAAGQDCAMWRIIRGRKICTEHKPGEENPYNVNYDAPHREVGEGGLVTVYSAARQGGQIMDDKDAREALDHAAVATSRPPQPVSATAPAPPDAAAPAEAGRTVEIADVLPQAAAEQSPRRERKRVVARKPAAVAAQASTKHGAGNMRKAPARTQPSGDKLAAAQR
jgi:hypothetical protein